MTREQSDERLRIGLLAGSVAVLIVLSVSMVVSAGTRWTGFRAFESSAIDLAFRMERAVSAGVPDSSIVIIDIDNRSLERYHDELGRWPWPRNVHAALLEYVTLGEPRSIAFDILFAEPDLARPEADSTLVAAHSAARRVFHAAFFRDRGRRAEREVPRLERFALPPPAQSIEAPVYGAADAPLPALTTAATGVGSITRTPDPDGVSRLEPVVVGYAGRLHPSLALAIALGGPAGYEGIDARERELIVGGRSIPLEEGRTLLRWRGGYTDRVYPVIPAHAILTSYVQTSIGEEPEVDATVFSGRDVIVGSSAAGVSDLFPTPFGPAEPGILVHATLLDTIRTGDTLHPIGIAWSILYIVVWTMLGALLLALVTDVARFGLVLALLLTSIVGVYLVAFMAWDRVVPVVLPGAGTLVASALAMGGSYLVEGRRHREIKGAFGKFIPADVVEMIANARHDLYRQTVRREITVMFCDVRGFTTLSERRDPSDVVTQLNTFLGAMVESVFEHGGTLDKYLGDGLMAFFGAPVDDEDHAASACAAALSMIERLATLNESWADGGHPRLAIGIGVHTGEAVVGFVGDPDRRMDYTAIGDTVNLASRLEGVTKSEGVPIVISGETARRIGTRFVTRLLGTREVKGKAERVDVHALEAGDRAS